MFAGWGCFFVVLIVLGAVGIVNFIREWRRL